VALSRETLAEERSRGRSPWRFLLGVFGPIVVLVVAFAIFVVVSSGVSLHSDRSALARLSVGAFGGSVTAVHAYGRGGRPIPLAVANGRLTPRTPVTPGESITVEVRVRRPGWDGWALGSTSRERLTVKAPVARASSLWLTVEEGASPRVRFDAPVSAVSYTIDGKATRSSPHGADSVELATSSSPGSALISAAARPWERVGAPTRVAWFPASPTPVVVASPAVGSSISPASPLRLTFSKPVTAVLGSATPKLTPSVPGHWRRVNSHTLVFTPSGYGAPFASRLRVSLPNPVGVSSSGGRLQQTSELDWTVPPGSTLRLQQLLAQTGYLPLNWSPSGPPVARTPAAEVKAATEPPAGSFSWRYPNTPASLQGLWNEREFNDVTKGAVMAFEHEHGLEVDGIPGKEVWHALIVAAMAGKRLQSGYTYVYVHREVPESLILWHDGQTVLTTPANTGIPGAETETHLGTYEVFEHIPEGTMEGVNPDGSHYHDEGIKWISYFNKGEAIHNFDRASFGTPQSLGCVELPLQAASEVWPYTPIGTLVTIET
jgi:hypothetical protein